MWSAPITIAVSPEYEKRIKEVGLWAWMDEYAKQNVLATPRKKPSRYSLEYKQARMKRRNG
jgi:hypothetical protein